MARPSKKSKPSGLQIKPQGSAFGRMLDSYIPKAERKMFKKIVRMVQRKT